MLHVGGHFILSTQTKWMVRLEIDSTMSNRRGSPSGDAQPWPPSGLSGPSVGDHRSSRAGCHWPTMEPSVKPFSVSLIRREPRSSEARWRKADWNGEAENGREATLRRPGAPRPASGRTFPPRHQNSPMPTGIGLPGRAVHRTAPTFHHNLPPANCPLRLVTSD
ncbi:MAG: hypothetical protein ACFWTX_07975 [Acidaminococcus timonensis]|jgi:hypothetical protein